MVEECRREETEHCSKIVWKYFTISKLFAEEVVSRTDIEDHYKFLIPNTLVLVFDLNSLEDHIEEQIDFLTLKLMRATGEII